MQDKAFSLFSTKSLNEDALGDFIVEGIASTPTLDSDNDKLNSLGATFRTMPFPFILNHDHNNPVGQVIEATPSLDGIKVKIRIPYVKELGLLKDQTDYAIHAINYNIISGLSVGFMANKSDALVNEKGGLNINKYEVYELSLTALQSNTTAFITAFKSLKQLAPELETNSNDETVNKEDDTNKEVTLNTDSNSAIAIEDVKEDISLEPLDVLEPVSTPNQTSDIVAVIKSKAVSLISTNTQKNIKVSLK